MFLISITKTCRRLIHIAIPQDKNEMFKKLKEILKKDEHCIKSVIPIFKKSFIFGNKIAIRDSAGEFSYLQLYAASQKLSIQLSNICGSAASSSISIVCPNNIIAVVAIWACWISGQVAVPLSIRYSVGIFKYLIKDSQSKVLITTPEFENFLKPMIENMELALLIVDHSFLTSEKALYSFCNTLFEINNDIIILGTLNNDFYAKSNAMIFYTSGANEKLIRMVVSHTQICAYIKYVTWAWHLSNSDCLLHVLPHNHVHGCINALMCPLSNGVKVIMHDYINSVSVWNDLLGFKAETNDSVTILMAVPTTYGILIKGFNAIFSRNLHMMDYIKNYCNLNIRLMVSGISPVKSNSFYMWREITGHHIVECGVENEILRSKPFIGTFNINYNLSHKVCGSGADKDNQQN